LNFQTCHLAVSSCWGIGQGHGRRRGSDVFVVIASDAVVVPIVPPLDSILRNFRGRKEGRALIEHAGSKESNCKARSFTGAKLTRRTSYILAIQVVMLLRALVKREASFGRTASGNYQPDGIGPTTTHKRRASYERFVENKGTFKGWVPHPLGNKRFLSCRSRSPSQHSNRFDRIEQRYLCSL